MALVAMALVVMVLVVMVLLVMALVMMALLMGRYGDDVSDMTMTSPQRPEMVGVFST
jgi:hypothetical protein